MSVTHRSAKGARPPSRLKRSILPLPFTGDAAALVQALREGRPDASLAFFERYVGRVERIITRVLGFDSELADVVQEVFAGALKSMHTLQDPSSLEPWLSRVAALTARKVLRGRSRRAWLRRFVDAHEEERYEPIGLEPDWEGRQALRGMYAVLASLPADERIAFALRFIDGMELTEVAAACNVSLATIKRRLGRAEQHFAAHARTRPELERWLNAGSRWQAR